jgi:hypothetical protein
MNTRPSVVHFSTSGDLALREQLIPLARRAGPVLLLRLAGLVTEHRETGGHVAGAPSGDRESRTLTENENTLQFAP